MYEANPLRTELYSTNVAAGHVCKFYTVKTLYTIVIVIGIGFGKDTGIHIGIGINVRISIILLY